MAANPLVSFVLVAYKQERFIRDAVRCALAQTYEPLEIIISDDCSPDRTSEYIEDEAAAYRGPHRLILNRNPCNLGLAANLNRAWELTSAPFVVIQAGDDISEPHRTAMLVRRWLDTSSPVDLVCSHFAEIDIDGRPTGVIRRDVMFVPDLGRDVTSWKCGATGACAAYSRRLHHAYGPLDPDVLTEDWVYSFRAWLESGIAVIEEPLLRHRTHGESISVAHQRTQVAEDPAVRWSRRRRMAQNQLAVAREWQRAWKANPKVPDERILKELRRLVRLRELQLRAFEASRLDALGMAWSTCVGSLGVANATKLFVRHVLRLY